MSEAAKKPVKKVVLAYSGGLDTSIILKWLQTEYNAEVVTFTADLGQGEELAPAKEKALKLGIKPENIFIDDLREEFVRDFVFPMFRANAQYEGDYLLGTSIARPLISKRQIEIARMVGADAVCHGATGKGNDQVRFELGYYALNPDIHVIAPWREWEFRSREALLDFAEKNQIPISKDKRGEAPFSVDANLLHSSSEGKVLEDPALEAPEFVHMRTISPEDAPNEPTVFTMDFEGGGGQLEADLVVALAGGAVGDGGRAFLQGDLDHALGDERARDGRPEEVLAFVDRVGAHHREDEVLGEFGLEVVDVDLARAGGQRLLLQALELLRLADVGRERDDFGPIILLEPLQNDRGVQAARICQYDFHGDPSCAPEKRENGNTRRFSQESKRRKLFGEGLARGIRAG